MFLSPSKTVIQNYFLTQKTLVVYWISPNPSHGMQGASWSKFFLSLQRSVPAHILCWLFSERLSDPIIKPAFSDAFPLPLFSVWKVACFYTFVYIATKATGTSLDKSFLNFPPNTHTPTQARDTSLPACYTYHIVPITLCCNLLVCLCVSILSHILSFLRVRSVYSSILSTLHSEWL